MKKPTRKLITLIAVLATIFIFGLFALGSGDSGTEDQGSASVQTSSQSSNLSNYSVEIKSCRFAEDYEGKPIVIVKYAFTNNDEDPIAFYLAFDDTVYQNGVGLNECYVADDSANYSSDNQTKEIKKGATIEVEIAYELNDSKTDIEVEVSQLFSLSDKKITKTFKIS